MTAVIKDPGLEFRRLVSRTGWTQAQIADSLGLSQASVSQWASKGVPAGRALELARLLSVPIEDVEVAVYLPPRPRKRQRAPYRVIEMEGSEAAKERLVSLLNESSMPTSDLELLIALVQRMNGH